MVRGAGGIDEGIPEALAEITLPKFRDGGLLIAHAGGGAGLFSGIIGGWASGEIGSEPVTVEVAHMTHVARPDERAEPGTRERAPRPASLDGLTIGLLDITKPRGDVFLDRLDEPTRRAWAPRSSASRSRPSPSLHPSTCATRSRRSATS